MKRKISYLFLTFAFLLMGSGLVSVNKAKAVTPPPADTPLEKIEPISYSAHFYGGTISWCCYSGGNGCIPSNC